MFCWVEVRAGDWRLREKKRWPHLLTRPPVPRACFMLFLSWILMVHWASLARGGSEAGNRRGRGKRVELVRASSKDGVASISLVDGEAGRCRSRLSTCWFSLDAVKRGVAGRGVRRGSPSGLGDALLFTRHRCACILVVGQWVRIGARFKKCLFITFFCERHKG